MARGLLGPARLPQGPGHQARHPGLFPPETCRELLGRSADLKAPCSILPSQDFCEMGAINVPTLQRDENMEAFASRHDCQIPSERSGSLGSGSDHCPVLPPPTVDTSKVTTHSNKDPQGVHTRGFSPQNGLPGDPQVTTSVPLLGPLSPLTCWEQPPGAHQLSTPLPSMVNAPVTLASLDLLREGGVLLPAS